jgi:hypothetical protein
MTVYLRTALAAGIIALSFVGNAYGAAGSAVYPSRADHFSFTHPASWTVNTSSTADMHDSYVAKIASTAFETGSPDNRAAFEVFVAHQAIGTAALKATLNGLLHDNDTVLGSVKSTSATINGVRYLRRAALVGTRSGNRVEMSILGASHGSRTYYLVTGYLTKTPAATRQDKAYLVAVLASFKLT